ncbi:hypothetical protein BS47DRAFT_1381382 [Hydnum rufescens UP504]|uniref:Yeast cell wall synthesis Kre9/Knh1-like N-terminal domain-containing protein n=1 Tax=Hydnum rufescens UP504 TaxID=1448309 RepID=A0A9P6DYJ3_9AGAM|nr:hypothetical protein BS47DRAFT_1381382 [Hydnum rufescens UP504]
MLFTAALLVLPFGLAVAAPSATVPGPNDKYTEGGNCTIAWTADTSGLWTTMNIELMTGPNSPMVHLRTVATVNAQTTTSFSWPCPMVSPNSAIYFYQFSSQQDQANTNWATRFLIAATDGSSTPPTDVTSTGVAYAYLIGNGQVVGAPNTTAPGPVSLAASSSSTSSSSSTDTASSLSLSASRPQSPSTISSSQSSTSTSSASTSSATSGSIRKATATISGASLWVITASVALLGTIAGTLL